MDSPDKRRRDLQHKLWQLCEDVAGQEGDSENFTQLAGELNQLLDELDDLDRRLL